MGNIRRESHWLRNTLIVLVIALPVGFVFWKRIQNQRMLDFSLQMTSEWEQQIWEDMKSKPLDVSTDWLGEPELPSDLLQLVEVSTPGLHYENWDYPDQELLEKLRDGRELSAEEREDILDYLKSQNVRIERVLEIVGHSEYQFGVGDFGRFEGGMSLGPIRVALTVEVRWAILDGDCAEAVDDILHLIRLVRHSPPISTIDFVTTRSTIESGCSLVHELIGSCSEKNELRRLWDGLLELRPEIRHSEIENVLNYLAFQEMKNMEDLGYSAELEEGMTLLEYKYACLDKGVESELNRNPSLAHLWEAFIGYPLEKFSGKYDILFAGMLSSSLDLFPDFYAANAQVDLALLNLANRIHELKVGTKVNNSSELVPEFFEEVPTDPFTGEPYLWDVDKEEFYSEAVREQEAEREEMRMSGLPLASGSSTPR
ncbi:MAG: hypothetical protein H6752_07465 [Candidatus Omnitrophica bacterium]|nr:hypothetical protein [Candidatus Omnitrophota bacterium]